MENITSTAELLEAIQILEAEQAGHLEQVKENFFYTRQSLKPVNIIGSSLQGLVASPNLLKNIVGITAGLFTGYLSRKVMLASVTNNKYGKILSNVVQFGITSVVARGPQVIQSFKDFLARRIYRMRGRNNSKP
jgi:hypothetical protein